MTSTECIAVIKTGEQCKRNAVKDCLCTQHYKMSQILPPDLTNNILSEYIPYDQLIELESEFSDLKIDPKRVEKRISEDVHSMTEEVLIDGIVRKKSQYQYGKLFSENNYNSAGKLDGLQKVWYSGSGNIKYETNYSNGVRTGLYTKYYDDEENTIEEQGNYENDKKEGVWNYYYNNGTVWMRGPYKDDKQEGLWMVYNGLGQLSKTHKYKNGKLILE